MAVDINALRNKLNQLKGGANRSDILWKPQEGDNQVRILPLATNPDNPFIELYFHYLGNKTYLSSLSFGERDPIAEFAENLRSAGGLTKDEYRETKKFVPQIRTFVPVIDRKNPDAGVRFWAFGKTVYQELLGVMADPDYGDITDPQTGRDIKVSFTPQEKSDTGFAKTAVRVSPKTSALTTEADKLETWITEQPDLMSLYKRMSFDELKDVLDKFVNGGPSTPTQRVVTQTSDDDWGDTDTMTSPTASKSRAKAPTKAAADVEDEFAALFDK
jgi:hypothetical protein